MGYDMYLKGLSPEDLAAYEQASSDYEAALKRVSDLGWDVDPVDPTEEQLKAFFQTLDRVEGNALTAWAIVLGASDEVVEAVRVADEKSPGDPYYFRLNIWGMNTYCDAMLVTGMAFDSLPVGDWPPQPPNVSDEDLEAYECGADDLSDEVVAACEDYEARRIDFLSDRAGDGFGIPLHKLSSNDGWNVTPKESEEALAGFARFIGHQGRDVVEDYRALPRDERRNQVRAALKAKKIEEAHGAELVETITEDYFVAWLGFLRKGSRANGFEVW